ncbi:MAG: hypothetical protein ABIH26_12305 [Candidatus Eisenbacteria bacterium]
MMNPPPRFFGHRVPLGAVGLLLVGLSLAAYSPYFGAGFSGDDFIFLSMLEGAVPYDPLPGFWYGRMDSFPAFQAIWWLDPAVEGAFLRPLASWTLTLLYGTFGRNAVPYHVLLAAMHGLVAFTAFLVLRRLSKRDGVSLLAALLFLVCEDHGMTVAWITTITDLLCALFLNLALLTHIVSREERRRSLFVLPPVLFLAAVTSKETAIVYPLIVAAYEFFFAERLAASGEGVPKGARGRLSVFVSSSRAWGVPLLVPAGYLLLYLCLLPPMRNLLYIDPIREPARYLGALLGNLPVMAAGLLTQFLPSLVILLPKTLPWARAGGAVLILLLGWALLPHRRERALLFALAAFVIALLPGLATAPAERLLYTPSTYGFYVVAWLIAALPPLRRRVAADLPRGVRVLGSAWGWYLLLSAAAVPVVLLFFYPSMWISGMRLPERTVLRSLPLLEEAGDEHVVYLNTSSSFNTFYLSDVYRYYLDEFIDVRVLSSFNGRMRARSEGERVLVLKTEDDGWLGNMFARIARVNPELSPGDTYETDLFTAAIREITSDGREAREVRFEFRVPLGDPSLALLMYDGESYRRWTPSPEWQALNPTIDPHGF